MIGECGFCSGPIYTGQLCRCNFCPKFFHMWCVNDHLLAPCPGQALWYAQRAISWKLPEAVLLRKNFPCKRAAKELIYF